MKIGHHMGFRLAVLKFKQWPLVQKIFYKVKKIHEGVLSDLKCCLTYWFFAWHVCRSDSVFVMTVTIGTLGKHPVMLWVMIISSSSWLFLLWTFLLHCRNPCWKEPGRGIVCGLWEHRMSGKRWTEDYSFQILDPTITGHLLWNVRLFNLPRS